MSRPPARKLSLARRLREVLTGLAALALLMALFFALLRWRANTPEEHLDFDIANDHPPAESHE